MQLVQVIDPSLCGYSKISGTKIYISGGGVILIVGVGDAHAFTFYVNTSE